MWQIETYNQSTRRWAQHGSPTKDFAAAYKKIASLQETGNKARLVKIEEPAAADICDNDCEHCDWATCPKEDGTE